MHFFIMGGNQKLTSYICSLSVVEIKAKSKYSMCLKISGHFIIDYSFFMYLYVTFMFLYDAHITYILYYSQ